MSEDEVVVLMMIFMGVIMLASIAFAIWMLAFLSSCLASVPPEHRRMEPGMVWLMLVPLFNLVWMFFVYVRVPKSFASYFHSIGEHDVGDAGEGLGIAIPILNLISSIPYVNCLTSPVALILLIVYLIKMNELKKRALMGPPSGYGGGYGPPPGGGYGGGYGGPPPQGGYGGPPPRAATVVLPRQGATVAAGTPVAAATRGTDAVLRGASVGRPLVSPAIRGRPARAPDPPRPRIGGRVPWPYNGGRPPRVRPAGPHLA